MLVASGCCPYTGKKTWQPESLKPQLVTRIDTLIQDEFFSNPPPPLRGWGLYIFACNLIWWAVLGFQDVTKQQEKRRNKEKKTKKSRKNQPKTQQKPPRFCAGFCWPFLTIKLGPVFEILTIFCPPIEVTAIFLKPPPPPRGRNFRPPCCFIARYLQGRKGGVYNMFGDLN